LEEHDKRANSYALEGVSAAEDVCVLCSFPSKHATGAIGEARKLFSEHLTFEDDFSLDLQQLDANELMVFREVAKVGQRS